MIQPLNYTTKAISDLIANAQISAPYTKKGLLYLVERLRRAEVFILPENGELLDRGRPCPLMMGREFRPPFPIVALEYSVADDRPYDPATQNRCAKRIVLAWEWDRMMPGGLPIASNPPAGEAVALACISYFEDLRGWWPIGIAPVFPFEVSHPENKTTFTDMIPLMPEGIQHAAASSNMNAVMDALVGDLSDEVNCYKDFCRTLACNNVAAVRHSQPERLNRARIKRGELPLKDFHVLQIGGHDAGQFGAGPGSTGARSHLRRGHIRRLGPERTTWVRACMVRGSRPGFVDKQYSVPVANRG
jgi:hypothetical protein